jgi:hypothetical protein
MPLIILVAAILAAVIAVAAAVNAEPGGLARSGGLDA